MNASIHPRAATASVPLQQASSTLIELMNALRRLALRIDEWLCTRRRADEDHDVLASMSDRELLDIGLQRGALKSVAEGAWRRDYPY